MTNVFPISAAQSANDAIASASAPPSTGGGGGGTMDVMEARVKRLEDKFDRIDDRLGQARTDLAVLTERVSHLPSKGFIVGAVLSSLAVIAALILFQDKLTQLLG